MAENELSSNRTISELFESISAAGDVGRARLLDIADRKTQRLQVAQKRLQSQLGPDHPRVKRLTAKATRAGAMQAEIKTLAERTAVKVSDWAIRGRVLDPRGAPVTDVEIQMVDKEKAYAELLGSTKTQAHGDFALIYPAEKLEELLKKAPDLYLSVTDAEGKTLYSAAEPIHCELGKLEWYEIRLADKPTMTKRKKTSVRKPARKKTTKRSPRSKGAGKSEE